MTYLSTLRHYLGLNFLQSSLFDFSLCVHFPLSGIIVHCWSDFHKFSTDMMDSCGSFSRVGLIFRLGKLFFSHGGTHSEL